MKEEKLFKQDKEVIATLQSRHIETESLEHIFGRININERFEKDEKEYLKKILIDNINNAYKRTHHQ